MNQYLCISATLLSSRYHGREWPPAPTRLFQALLAGARTGIYARQWSEVEPTLRLLESLSPPEVVAADAPTANRYRISVPNNDSDRAAREWIAGRPFDLTRLRTLKTVVPRECLGDPTGGPHLYYIWNLEEKKVEPQQFHRLASFLHTLGWGVDMAYADSVLVNEKQKKLIASRPGYSHHVPAGTGELRGVPVSGYLDDLTNAYHRFCNRIAGKAADPSTRATKYAQQAYQVVGSTQLCGARFALRQLENSNAWYVVPWVLAQRVAAWMRHAVAEALRQEQYDEDFINSYVLGHGKNGHQRHMSFVPVPTIRTMHADGGVRRVMLVEPPGADGSVTKLLQWKLAPSVLRGWTENSSNGGKPKAICSLVEGQQDGVWSFYLPREKKCLWRSVTPVVLHGYNSQHGKFSLKKTEELLYQALENSGYPRHSLTEICFQAAPFWPGTEGALAIRVPQHLSKWPRYHVAVRFHEPVGGPLLVGIGRHYGIGLFAAAD